MREAFDMLPFVYAAYAVTIFSTLALVWWSLNDMRRAEKRREESRRK